MTVAANRVARGSRANVGAAPRTSRSGAAHGPYDDEADMRFSLIWKSALRASALTLALHAASATAATSILFIGNSFTYGAGSNAVQFYRPDTVTDLRGTGIGGVPALFKAFTVQAGLDYDVFLETQPGSNLDYHYDNQLPLIDRHWDKVAMHGQSNLDFASPGNPARISEYTGLLGSVFQAHNPDVDVTLVATWSRADLTYANTSSPWYGMPIEAMAYDVWAGYRTAAMQNPTVVDRVSPVGLAWDRAMKVGVADDNPYDGVEAGQINLWTTDHYHASAYGSYLRALVDFGMITGVDPRTLGGREQAAVDLGFSAGETYAMQAIAWETISAIPEPSTWLMFAAGGGLVGWLRRRAVQAA